LTDAYLYDREELEKVDNAVGHIYRVRKNTTLNYDPA
jgi:hypothetical protein